MTGARSGTLTNVENASDASGAASFGDLEDSFFERAPPEVPVVPPPPPSFEDLEGLGNLGPARPARFNRRRRQRRTASASQTAERRRTAEHVIRARNMLSSVVAAMVVRGAPVMARARAWAIQAVAWATVQCRGA